MGQFAQYRFAAVYLTQCSYFSVYAWSEVEARTKAKEVASKALCIILRKIVCN